MALNVMTLLFGNNSILFNIVFLSIKFIYILNV